MAERTPQSRVVEAREELAYVERFTYADWEEATERLNTRNSTMDALHGGDYVTPTVSVETFRAGVLRMRRDAVAAAEAEAARA